MVNAVHDNADADDDGRNRPSEAGARATQPKPYSATHYTEYSP